MSWIMVSHLLHVAASSISRMVKFSPSSAHLRALYTMLRKRRMNIYYSPVVYLILGQIHLYLYPLVLTSPLLQMRKIEAWAEKKNQRNSLLSIS